MQLEREKTEKLFEKLSPREKLEFINKGILSGLIKEQKDTDYWKSKIPSSEISQYNDAVIDFYRDTIIHQVELNQEQAKIRINTMLLVADWVEKNLPREAELLKERAKEDAEFFDLDIEKIRDGSRIEIAGFFKYSI